MCAWWCACVRLWVLACVCLFPLGAHQQSDGQRSLAWVRLKRPYSTSSEPTLVANAWLPCAGGFCPCTSSNLIANCPCNRQERGVLAKMATLSGCRQKAFYNCWRSIHPSRAASTAAHPLLLLVLEPGPRRGYCFGDWPPAAVPGRPAGPARTLPGKPATLHMLELDPPLLLGWVHICSIFLSSSGVDAM